LGISKRREGRCAAAKEIRSEGKGRGSKKNGEGSAESGALYGSSEFFARQKKQLGNAWDRDQEGKRR